MAKKKKPSPNTRMSKKEQEAYRRVNEKYGLSNGVLIDGLQRLVAWEMYLMDEERKANNGFIPTR